VPERYYEWAEKYDDAVAITRDYLADNADRALGGSGGGGGDLDVARGPDQTPGGFLPTFRVRRQMGRPPALVAADPPRQTKNGWTLGTEQGSLPEDHVGGVVGPAEWLTYPKISSCIGLLCVLPGRIVGMHITVSTTEEELGLLTERLRTDLIAGRRILALFAFGPPSMWRERTGFQQPARDARPWGVAGLDGAVGSLKERVGFAGQAWVADQPEGTSMHYRARLLREYASPGVTLARRLDGEPDDRYRLLAMDKNAPDFRLL